MKTYWRQEWRFSNEYNLYYYNLYYTEDREHFDFARAMGLMRISREEAIALCREERLRRVCNSSFSGYSATHICPLLHTEVDFDNYPWERRGWFIEYVGRGERPD